jgi:hypothetical protein
MKNETKVTTTLSITRAAQNIMLDNGYASQRTMGEFVSRLIVEHHARRTSPIVETMTAADLIYEIKRLVVMLDKLIGD